MARTQGYYAQPCIHGDHIVFVCEDDLWSVSASGGPARRLTTSRGAASQPRLSPDGKLLAFAARDEGPSEIYVMPSSGGEAQRLTWLGSFSTPVGWTTDSRQVAFQSNAEQHLERAFGLWTVDAKGGHPAPLDVGWARDIAWQSDGPGVVLGINTADPARWKRYRGGTAGRLWIDRQGAGNFKSLIDLDGNLANAMWIGKRIYFLSDHEGFGNLYSCTPTGRDLRRHTDHDDFYARFARTDGKSIVYTAGADLFCLDVATDETRAIDVQWYGSRTGRRSKHVPATGRLESADLHPAGHSVALVSRGALVTAGLWEGAPLRHGEVSTARYRLARWLPAGERLVAITDERGEEELVVMKADGAGRRKRVGEDLGRALDLEPAPRGADRVALANHRQEVLIVDLATGSTTRVETSKHDRIGGLAWSPDGRWLAYGFAARRQAMGIHLYDTEKGKVHEVTRPDFIDFGPSFDASGRYLLFLSRRAFDPVYDEQYFELGFPRGIQPCLIPLAADAPSPFAAGTRSPRAPNGAVAGAARKKKNADEATRIDLAGIAGRVVAFPVPEGRYVRVEGGRGYAFFSSLPIEGSLSIDWRSSGPPPAKAKLERYDFRENKTEVVVGAITDFGLSGDRKTLLLRVRNHLRALLAAVDPKEVSPKRDATRETGWLDMARFDLQVDPPAEWRQMYDEAWRLMRDHFWVPDMSKVDWRAVHARYAPLIDRVASRSEFSDLMWEMQGELGTSHCYELFGDYRPEPRWFQGFLGADLRYAPRLKAWRIARIPQGDSWIASAASPLAAPGLGLSAGDTIHAVDGKPVGPKRSPQACLVNRARKDVVLTVQSKGGPKRQVTIKTLAAEHMLRYRDWVEQNRAAVHKATRGRVGYVHIPNMGPWGFSEFHRYYRQEVDRPGLIIDVRWNGGGHVSQLLLEKLRRRRIGYNYPRWMGIDSYPEDAPMGPMVALTNEHAGSDGDMFSHAFKLFGLGPLIGKRTWGGVVGIWPRHALVDGTVTTQAEFAFWFEDVAWGVENYGTDPDIEVEFWPQDHAAGRDPQLERSIREAEKLIRKLKPRLPGFSKKPVRKPPRLPKR